MPIFFVTVNLPACLNTEMSPALKACARRVLTFVQLVIVVAFVVSLAAIAALSCLGARKRSRASEIPSVPFESIQGSRGLTAQ